MRILLFLLLTALASAQPARWDDFSVPTTPSVADGLSLRLNEACAAEVLRVGGPSWWVSQVTSHCQQNRRAAGQHPEAPALTPQGRRFVADYVQEQLQLARIQPRHPSEVRWRSDEESGWGLPDRSFRLTFDDGPRRATSEPILATLRQFHAPATFFVLGNHLDEHHPNYDGFTVASHSYDHQDLLTLNQAQVQAELTDTEKQAQRCGVKLAPLFRAPYGSRSGRELDLLKKRGLRSVLWNVDSQDWQQDMQSRPGRISSRTLALLLLHRRGIVLMHDVQPKTPAELSRLLTALPRLGFQIVP